MHTGIIMNSEPANLNVSHLFSWLLSTVHNMQQLTLSESKAIQSTLNQVALSTLPFNPTVTTLQQRSASS